MWVQPSVAQVERQREVATRPRPPACCAATTRAILHAASVPTDCVVRTPRTAQATRRTAQPLHVLETSEKRNSDPFVPTDCVICMDSYCPSDVTAAAQAIAARHAGTGDRLPSAAEYGDITQRSLVSGASRQRLHGTGGAPAWHHACVC